MYIYIIRMVPSQSRWELFTPRTDYLCHTDHQFPLHDPDLSIQGRSVPDLA